MRTAVKGALVLALLTLLPIASACADAGGPLAPGDYILITDHSCSLAFVLVDENGIYFATAGHCVKVNQTVLDKNNKLVGVGAFHYLNPETGSETDGSPGEDFGLIAIDPANYGRITPALCGWGGPTGVYEEKPGSGGVKHYGHGAETQVLPDNQKQGLSLQNDGKAFYWTGTGTPGDSGSAVISDDGRALGVLTHLGVFGATSDNGGTHLDRGLQLAAEKGGFTHLRLVLGNEDAVALYHQMQANATLSNATTPVAKPTSGPAGSANSTTSGPPASNGTAPTTPTGSSGADKESPAAVNQPSDAVKRAPGPEVALVLACLAGIALRRPKTLK